MNLHEYKKTIDQWDQDFRIAKDKISDEKERLKKSKRQLKSAREAQQVAQDLAEFIQQKAHTKISEIVSRCLEGVFDEPYNFKIAFEQKRGKTEARLVFERNGMEVDPMTASGGGVVDVAAFALRISCLMLSRPPLQRVLIFDEPFRFVSEEYRERVREMIETVSEELGVQIIQVTHSLELQAGKIIKI